ncbi:energy coupling factor transporter S component ThiW [Thermaerobacter sp. PB12/4term]|uniref:energy coupling factor transporter S component ThiW n=1 Tax=Thermaerobacter sp. PB12/4term TaxID=2293838 RepID=UPI000E32C5A3|nr:energy coupling factor transporter S component ThiW [Thermaerobacter sp. PB12/4term]QIA27760.1 energy coupling factor transporter S component ThiW [Thermaerobacter sp. PB12/4term]
MTAPQPTAPPGRTRRLVRAAMLIALGTVLAGMVRVPVGVATATPVQHAVNVLAAAWFGPAGAVTVAFLISLLRNLLGLGTLLAFPGSLFGAALAGLAYRAARRPAAAMAGEVVGTGLVGGLAAFPVARWLLGQAEAAWFFYVVPFTLSSLLGALVGGLLLRWLPAPARESDGEPVPAPGREGSQSPRSRRGGPRSPHGEP